MMIHRKKTCFVTFIFKMYRSIYIFIYIFIFLSSRNLSRVKKRILTQRTRHITFAGLLG